MRRRHKRSIPQRSPRLGLAFLRSLSRTEQLIWLIFLGLTVISMIWAYR